MIQRRIEAAVTVRCGDVEDVGALVIARRHRPKVFAPVDRAPDLIAVPVHLLVEADGPTSCAAMAPTVRSLVLPLRDGVPDLASTPVTAISAGAVRFIAAEPIRPRPGTPAARALDLDAFQHWDELGVVAH